MKKYPIRTKCHGRRKQGDVVESDGGRELFFTGCWWKPRWGGGVSMEVPKLRAQQVQIQSNVLCFQGIGEV